VGKPPIVFLPQLIFCATGPSMKGKEKQEESGQTKLLFSRSSNDVTKKKKTDKRALDTDESLANMDAADSQAIELTSNSDSMLTETQPNGEELNTEAAIDSPEMLTELQGVGIHIYCVRAVKLTLESQDEWPPSPGRENSVPLTEEVEAN
jgi:hypothetical protein